MASESEALADIVAEIRAYGAQPPPRLMWLEIADRIEAAWRRERVGNAAAMHEALRQIKQMGIELRNIIPHLDKNWEECLKASIRIHQTAERALLEPPCNCDVGTPKEQFDRFAKHCIDKDCDSCEHGLRGRAHAHCALVWAQTPYKADRKGGAE